MAHEIDTTVNTMGSAVFARTPAWHRLGKVIPETCSTMEAIKHAGLDWTVSCRESFRYDNNRKMIQDPFHRFIIRDDTDKVLGMIGDQYIPAQNVELAGFLDAVVGLGARIESAGSLHGGGKVWFLCAMRESFDVLPNDEVKPYALFLNGHDGRTKLRVVPTTVRVVCQNTLSIATKGETLGMTVRHDGNLAANMQRAKEALGLVSTAAERMEAEAKALVAKKWNTMKLGHFFAEQVQALRFSEERTKEVMTELSILLEADTNTVPGMRGTAWQAVQTWNEWVDHAPRKTGADIRLESIWTGEGHRQKARAWEKALAV